MDSYKYGAIAREQLRTRYEADKSSDAERIRQHLINLLASGLRNAVAQAPDSFPRGINYDAEAAKVYSSLFGE